MSSEDLLVPAGLTAVDQARLRIFANRAGLLVGLAWFAVISIAPFVVLSIASICILAVLCYAHLVNLGRRLSGRPLLTADSSREISPQTCARLLVIEEQWGFYTCLTFAAAVLLAPILEFLLPGAIVHSRHWCLLQIFSLVALFTFSPAFDAYIHSAAELRERRKSGSPAPDLRELCRGVVRIVKTGAMSGPGWKILAACLVASFFERSILGLWFGPAPNRGLLLAAATALTMPGSSLLVLWLFGNWEASPAGRRALAPAEPRTSLLKRCERGLALATGDFLKYRLPFLSGLVAHVCFWAMLCLPPGMVGENVASFLYACARDANLAGLAPPGSLAVLATSAAVFLIPTLALAPLAIRLSALFQFFVLKLLSSSGARGLWESAIDALNIAHRRLAVADKHPALKTIADSILWICACYCFLFWLVAFCPGALGDAFRNWIDFSAVDANYPLTVARDPRLIIFAASIVAAYGTAPFAVMSCAFLPNKRNKALIINSYGLIAPSGWGWTGGLRLWRHLTRISLTKAGRTDRSRHGLRFFFRHSDPLSLDLRLLKSEDLALLLAAADQYAINCSLDKEVIRLRSELFPDKARLLKRGSEKFESTIFAPHNAGDFIIGHSAFRIVRQIASKSLSAVYVARDEQSRLVIIKQFVLPTDAETSRRQRQALEREYLLIKSLDHPLIARVLDVFDENNSSYLVLEYVSGEDLRSIVRSRGRRSQSQVRRWAREIADQMLYLHTQNPPVLHRDLTPDNVMLDDDGRIRIVDFGAAHQFLEGVTGTLIGKQAYIAPEQLRGKASPRSDIYSFGGTLNFLLTGKDPGALQQCAPSDEGIVVAADLEKLIRDCTAFDERDRPQSFQEILDRLLALQHKCTEPPL